MAAHQPFDGDRELDVRTVDGPPFDPIAAALEDLPPGETLVLVNSFEPEPLYDVFEMRGFSYRAEQVADDEWHVAVAHAE
jgi:uncharacterized protein (DUF2249 family)